jgi:hypothetical protein
LEGDAKGVIDVNCELADRSRLGHVIEDIKVELQELDQWQMTFVKRDGNKATLLSKYAVQHAVDKFWQEPPDCIREILLLEQIALAA